MCCCYEPVSIACTMLCAVRVLSLSDTHHFGRMRMKCKWKCISCDSCSPVSSVQAFKVFGKCCVCRAFSSRFVCWDEDKHSAHEIIGHLNFPRQLLSDNKEHDGWFNGEVSLWLISCNSVAC